MKIPRNQKYNEKMIFAE